MYVVFDENMYLKANGQITSKQNRHIGTYGKYKVKSSMMTVLEFLIEAGEIH